MLKQAININTQYADDCGYALISKDPSIAEYIKSTVPSILKNRHHICNEEKQKNIL